MISTKIFPQTSILQILLCVVATVVEKSPCQINLQATNPGHYDYANPDRLTPPPASAPGFPSRSPDLDVLPGFQNPPAGYGQVPFWWWHGDRLEKDRLLWQINELHKKGISGMQINYIHKDSPGWPTYPADPEIFSDSWWDMWQYAAQECGKRGMGIGLSGYTLDWPNGDNLFNRIIYNMPEIQGRVIQADTVLDVHAGQEIMLPLSPDVIGVWAYPAESRHDLTTGMSLAGFIHNSVLCWHPDKGRWRVWAFSAQRKPGTLNPIHPRSGQIVIDKFFQPFQDHAAGKSADGLNYFFQDELQFGVGDYIWCDDFNEAFKNMKGYDLFQALPALFSDIGPCTAKARLDFMDVKIQLSEERYFKPIFDWHWQRGKIYGCDPMGRGKEPGSYGDHFRAIRWYTAPGHDTPGGHADLIKGKVSSSIAGLYKRPRVWLEGYHSLGWGATPGQLMFATNENYLYGCNLLNLHGLYYSTHGSYWEWAPPCYHFRMPYWDHMGVFLKYFERLSYLLSQGVLQSNVAVLYPVSPEQARMGGAEATETAFHSGSALYNHGHDFIFMDDQSLMRSQIRQGRIQVSDLSLSVLVLPAMRAIRWPVLQKALEHFRKGGFVLAVGSLPEASDRAGGNDPELDAAVKEMFGVSATEYAAGMPPEQQTNPAGGAALFLTNAEQIKTRIDEFLKRDVQSDFPVKALHRKIGPRDVYMVMGAPKGSYCTFAAKGKAELWDPWTGEVNPIYETSKTPDGTCVRMPLDVQEAQVIVFTPDTGRIKIVSHQLAEVKALKLDNGRARLTGYCSSPGLKTAAVEINGQMQKLSGKAGVTPAPVSLDGDWEFELEPTMNNQWGDFRLPVTEPVIAAEARMFSYAEETSASNGWENPDIDDSSWKRVTYGFGQKFWKLGPIPAQANMSELDRLLARTDAIDPSVPVTLDNQTHLWQPYHFSWRMGLEGDPGHQGYHGLKKEVTDEFICLGKPAEGLNETLYLQEQQGTHYYLWTSAYADQAGSAIVDMGGLEPSAVFLNGNKLVSLEQPVDLNRGGNPLLLRYDSAGRGHFVLKQRGAYATEKRTPLAMRWWDEPGVLAFDVRPNENNPAGWYRFTAPPGLKGMTIRCNGDPQVWVDGKFVHVNSVPGLGINTCNMEWSKAIPHKAKVAIRIAQTHGNYGGAALPEPVLLDCSAGIARTGDWSQGSVLENYSGGAWYRKNIKLSEAQVSSRTILDLADVVATALVRVNGEDAGILVAPPWRLDISRHVKKGANIIEILVYNTLANHYLTIPSRYQGRSLKSGLLGPVKLEFSTSVVLQ